MTRLAPHSGAEPPAYGTVTLIEKCSGAVGSEAVATEHRWVVHISGGSVGRGDLTPDREAVGHLGSPFGRAEQMLRLWASRAARTIGMGLAVRVASWRVCPGLVIGSGCTA